MKRFLIALLLSLVSAAAFAGNGSANNVSIVEMAVYSSGKLVIVLSNNTTGGPTCSGGSGAMTVDGSTAGGAVVVAHAEAAYGLNKTISLLGDGTCNSDGYENINELWSS
jgi:hypothetical protein